MFRISGIFIIFNLLIRSGYGHPLIEEDVSDSLSEMIETSAGYSGSMLSEMSLMENAEMMTSGMESLMNYDSLVDVGVDSMSTMESMAEMGMGSSMSTMESMVDMGMGSMASVESAMAMNADSLMGAADMGYMMSSMQSTMGDATSMASSLMDYTSMINQDMFLSAADKVQYLQQLAQFSPLQFGAVSDLFGMLRDRTISHFQWKLSVIRAAKQYLTNAMEAMANGDIGALNSNIMSVISELQDCCPICRTLRYALENDQSLLPFVGGLSQSILGQMEMEFSESFEEDISISV